MSANGAEVCAASSRDEIVLSARGVYASYSSLVTVLPLNESRVVPLKRTVAPEPGSETHRTASDSESWSYVRIAMSPREVCVLPEIEVGG